MAPSTPDDSNDPAWDEALDWLLKVKAAPGDAGLQADLAQWLSQRESHATAYRRAERIWRLMGEVPPNTARRRHQSSTETAPGSMAMARRSRWRGIVSLAAGIVLVCILAFYAPTLWQSLQADYSTAVAETRQVTLSDGSVVSLNANSAIALHYSQHRRDVTLLRGEAFFVVADRDPRQFSVQADGMTVVDLGTSFNVNLGSTSLDVAVHSGVVEVHYKGDAGPGRTRLTTGEQLMVDRATGQTIRGVSPPSSMGAWRTGSIIVRGATISQVIDQVRRHYRGVVLVTDDRFAARKITGIYDLADPVAALRAAVEPHAGKVTRITPFLIVVSGP